MKHSHIILFTKDLRAIYVVFYFTQINFTIHLREVKILLNSHRESLMCVHKLPSISLKCFSVRLEHLFAKYSCVTRIG